MPEVVAIEWVIGLAIGGLVLGLLAGYGVSLRGGARSKVEELQTALDTAEAELADYKREVFGQFAETAEKFRALDKSYNDLHRQLATSSVALCGDAATPLLAGPGTEAGLEEKAVTDDAVSEDAVVEDTVAEDGPAEGKPAEGKEVPAAEGSAPEDPVVLAEETVISAEAPISSDETTADVAAADPATASDAGDTRAEGDDIVVGEHQDESRPEPTGAATAAQDDVPVLTDTDTDTNTEAPRRESA